VKRLELEDPDARWAQPADATGFGGVSGEQQARKEYQWAEKDREDAMWIQKLHSCGLLKSSFLPGGELVPAPWSVTDHYCSEEIRFIYRAA